MPTQSPARRWRISGPHRREEALFFFSLSSWQLALLILVVIASATIAGHFGGKRLGEDTDTLREPFGVLQAALLGVVGLILAFGLSLAVGRYEDRRAATVAEPHWRALRASMLTASTRRSTSSPCAFRH